MLTIFTLYLKRTDLTPVQANVAMQLVNGDIFKTSLKKSLREVGRSNTLECKEELIDLLLFYIEQCLDDHVLTKDEKLTIKHLRLLFELAEGDLYRFRKAELIQACGLEIRRILEDKQISLEEAFHEVDIQEVFDLSYDQWLEIAAMLTNSPNEYLNKYQV
jgi:hypothetical protein